MSSTRETPRSTEKLSLPSTTRRPTTLRKSMTTSAPSVLFSMLAASPPPPEPVSSEPLREPLMEVLTFPTLRSDSPDTTVTPRSTMPTCTVSASWEDTLANTWNTSTRKITRSTRSTSPPTSMPMLKQTVLRSFTKPSTRPSARIPPPAKRRNSALTSPSSASPSSPTTSARLPLRSRSRPRLLNLRKMTMNKLSVLHRFYQSIF
mmetsp:Transcript_20013/g.49800  ORF Transcript_20013/g.49800 Transcript_20013/m.49800 type:complete len:205 (-) Transcript_20013:29-643(-)